MDIIRYVDQDWHHYCDRSKVNTNTLYTNIDLYKAASGKKYAYLIFFNKEQNTSEHLKKKIDTFTAISDHVFFDFQEPMMSYKDPKHGWDSEHNCWDGPFYYTDDFINQFSKHDNITFFANLVSHVPLNRPLHYVNDMFFESINLYKEFEICKNLISKLDTKSDRKFFWELMCSNNVDLYRMLGTHPVNNSTFSTCHALGKSHWGPDVIAPTDGKSWAQTFGKYHNIRCSDLIDPSIYNESFYSCVVETVIPADNRMSMFSEKQAKPIITRRPFILVGTKDHLKAFRSLGFKTFSPVIDESYDDEPDMHKRYSMILDAMQKLCEQNPADVYQKLEHVLEHNHNHFYNHSWNTELQKAWLTPNLLSV